MNTLLEANTLSNKIQGLKPKDLSRPLNNNLETLICTDSHSSMTGGMSDFTHSKWNKKTSQFEVLGYCESSYNISKGYNGCDSCTVEYYIKHNNKLICKYKIDLQGVYVGHIKILEVILKCSISMLKTIN